MSKEKLVYIAHPSLGSEKNKNIVEDILRIIATSDNPEVSAITPICPILSFGSLYHLVSYEEGMDFCYSLLSRCDELWMIYEDDNRWEDSRGCNREIGFCAAKDIPVCFIKYDKQAKTLTASPSLDIKN